MRADFGPKISKAGRAQPSRSVYNHYPNRAHDMTRLLKDIPATEASAPPAVDRPLPIVEPRRPTHVRPSRTSRWRAAVLIFVHLIIIAHVIHWIVAGRTLSPVEPSEAMYTLNDGYLNAGFIFFALAIAATAIFGRFFCGWGCHLVAYQDLCASLLKRVGIKPKPFRSRILVLAPLALAIYMFVWPSLYRLFIGAPRPPTANHLITTEFWATFPGVTVAILTFALCGFAIIYVLGAKGFCTYACPYGGFFALADQIAPGRIVVNDNCEHCGHCTSVCSSNVRVHEEVALYGMVVDPGCMKCMDCVSVCPNDALSFGFSRPSLGAKPTATPRPVPYDFALWEELLMIAIGVAALVTYRGLYNQIPLLLAMGMAAMTAYLVIKLIRLFRDPHVRWQQLQLKRGRSLTRAGVTFSIAMAAWLTFTAHSAAIQYASWRGRSEIDQLALGDDVWQSQTIWWSAADESDRARLETAITRLESADNWGLMTTPLVLNKLVWAYLARGDLDRAESTLNRLAAEAPDSAEPHRGLAWVMRKRGRTDAAIVQYETALERDPKSTTVRHELAALLIEQGRFDQAEKLYRAAISQAHDTSQWTLPLAQLLLRQKRPQDVVELLEPAVAEAPDSADLHSTLGTALLLLRRTDDGLSHLGRAVELNPDSGQAQYNLGYALLSLNRTADAIPHLQRAVTIDDSVALWHYNLAVATFMSGAPDKALPHIRKVTELDPNDPQAWGFRAVILESLGDIEGARHARRQAESRTP